MGKKRQKSRLHEWDETPSRWNEASTPAPKFAANVSISTTPIGGISGEGPHIHWTMNLFKNPPPKVGIQLSLMELSSKRPFQDVKPCLRDARATAALMDIEISQIWVPAQIAFPNDPKKGLKGRKKARADERAWDHDRLPGN